MVMRIYKTWEEGETVSADDIYRRKLGLEHVKLRDFCDETRRNRQAMIA
jgi:hypothetical protein